MYEITITLDNGQTFIHNPKTPEELQANVEEIMKNGYLHPGARLIVHYPLHRISHLTYGKKDLKLPIEKAN